MGPGGDDRPRARMLVLSTTLPSDPAAASQSRAFVAKALTAWQIRDELSDDILLSCSELVTNAVEHGDGEVSLRLRHDTESVELQVGDEGGGTPEVHPFGVRSERSRGLAIVEALASDWGWSRSDRGKSVWARFAL